MAQKRLEIIEKKQPKKDFTENSNYEIDVIKNLKISFNKTVAIMMVIETSAKNTMIIPSAIKSQAIRNRPRGERIIAQKRLEIIEQKQSKKDFTENSNPETAVIKNFKINLKKIAAIPMVIEIPEKNTMIVPSAIKSQAIRNMPSGERIIAQKRLEIIEQKQPKKDFTENSNPETDVIKNFKINLKKTVAIPMVIEIPEKNTMIVPSAIKSQAIRNMPSGERIIAQKRLEIIEQKQPKKDFTENSNPETDVIKNFKINLKKTVAIPMVIEIPEKNTMIVPSAIKSQAIRNMSSGERIIAQKRLEIIEQKQPKKDFTKNSNPETDVIKNFKINLKKTTAIPMVIEIPEKNTMIVPSAIKSHAIRNMSSGERIMAKKRLEIIEQKQPKKRLYKKIVILKQM